MGGSDSDTPEDYSLSPILGSGWSDGSSEPSQGVGPLQPRSANPRMMDRFRMPYLPIVHLSHGRCFAKEVCLAITNLVESRDDGFFFVAGKSARDACVVWSLGECPVDLCVLLVRPQAECRSFSDLLATIWVNWDELAAALKFRDWHPGAVKCEYLFDSWNDAVAFVRRLRNNDDPIAAWPATSGRGSGRRSGVRAIGRSHR